MSKSNASPITVVFCDRMRQYYEVRTISAQKQLLRDVAALNVSLLYLDDTAVTDAGLLRLFAT